MAPRQTKIVCTIGPACSDSAILAKMMRAGMNVARMNLSHGTHQEHRARIRQVRKVAADLDHTLAVLFDLQGPKMRVGRLKGSGPVELVNGRSFFITTDNIVGDERGVNTTYYHLPTDVKKGDTILLDDGRIHLSVQRIQQQHVHCRVEHGGLLAEHKGINLPGVALSAPALTAKDLQDLQLAIAERVDYIALSFVRSRRDVQQLRRWLHRHNAAIPIIAKIERGEALDKLDEILAESDGVMVARGDLGVELSLAKVPVLQKKIIAQANRSGKLVITATQMLETMIDKPVPTRAEATDIANAIFDRTDAVMLSGETAAGKYPVEAVQTMADIIAEAEASSFARADHDPAGAGWANAMTAMVVHAASEAAKVDAVRAIMTFTMTGTTVQTLSKQRPVKPVLALTADVQVARRMALYWGVESFLTKLGQSTDAMIAHGERVLLKSRRLRRGDLVVVVAGTTQLKGATNMIKFLTV